jgi:cation diffusion facilitator CzcD-associated flavoprotein CzcO
MHHADTAVIGAGPYGLSIAAHLRAAGSSAVVLGRPLESWTAMPRGMMLKSPWSASSLSDPRREFTLDRYVWEERGAWLEPIPLRMFVEYCAWFTRRAVGGVEETMVHCVDHADGRFRLALSDGRQLEAARVVVATGIGMFAHLPDFARDLPRALASHTQDHRELARFRGARVLVVGAGQSALESAALLAESGAEVELIARDRVRWVDRRLYERTGPLRHLLYPPSDVGPVGINWLVSFPGLVRHLPEPQRLALTVRAIRPSGARWLRERFQHRVITTESTQVVTARPHGGGVRLELSDGSIRDGDHLLCGTGYRPQLARLPFLAPELLAQVRQAGGYPVLDGAFQSSVPGLHFVGALASHSFGPLCRFVAGAGAAARRVSLCA